MHPYEASRVRDNLRDLCDTEATRVRCEDRFGLRVLGYFAPYGVFNPHPLGDGLDDDVRVPDGVCEAEGHADPP